MADDNRGFFTNWSLGNLFGFRLDEKKPSANTTLPTLPIHDKNPTFATPITDDGAVILQGGGHYGTYLDQDISPRNEVEQITKYREIAEQAEVQSAINDISNEAISRDDSGKVVNLVLDNLEVPDFIKEKIATEFNKIIKLLNFNEDGLTIFNRWYIDGRIYYHVIIDKDHPEFGITELRFIDPRKIRKIKEIIKMRDLVTGMEVVRDVREYYMFNERGILGMPTNFGVKIAPDSILYVPSGLLDAKQNIVISYLQKALKPMNQLRMEEDALVIYRLARAAERRVFYVDVGNMPAQHANQYVQNLMTKYKNKLVYDANTGEIRDDRRHLSMLEDFWLPRREGSKGTEIDTLPGGENLGKIDDIEYFLKKLYKALDVPISRLEPQPGFSLGRSAEITRDELKFIKHIEKLRLKFSQLLSNALRIQLVLKGVCTEEDWDDFREHIYFDFYNDINITELKDQELWRERFGMVSLIDPYIGKYVSGNWIRKNVLKQTDDEIAEIDQEIEQEKSEMRFQNPMLGGGAPGMFPPELGGGQPFGGGMNSPFPPPQGQPQGNSGLTNSDPTKQDNPFDGNSKTPNKKPIPKALN